MFSISHTKETIHCMAMHRLLHVINIPCSFNTASSWHFSSCTIFHCVHTTNFVCFLLKNNQAMAILSFQKYLFLNYVYMCVGMHTCVQVPAESRGKCWISRTWSCMWLWATRYGCWEPKSNPLQGQYVILTTEPFLRHVSSFFDF